MVIKRRKQPVNERVLGLDLGNSQIKAAVLGRTEQGWQVSAYAVRKLPPAATPLGDIAPFVAELQQVMDSLKVTERQASVVVNCSSVIVCHTEVPRMPLEEVRNALRLQSFRYLRHDFSKYYLDAMVLADAVSDDKEAKTPKMNIMRRPRGRMK